MWLGCDTPPSLPSFLISPSLMARVRLRHCPRQGQRPHCPSCGKRFTDVLRHLNHPLSKCVDWFNTTMPRRHLSSHPYEYSTEEPTDSPILDDPPNIQRVPFLSHCQPYAQCVGFSGAATTYSRAKSFMDRFDDDRYSEFRTTNIYYPFAGKDEWELGSFLLSSGLSMRKIDNFLQLKMVNLPTSHLVATH